ncbi:MAG: septum formation family protein [Demequinaceae bacterium]|nr:septum formation family protein [Demequinaceae bacterium]
MKTRVYVGLAAALVMTLAGCSTESLADLRAGDCFNVALTDEEQIFSQVPTVDCSKPHTAEVYKVSDISASYTYDEDEVFNMSLDLCYDAFEAYVGVDYFDPLAADLDFTFFYPPEEEWEAGERSVTCAVIRLDPTEDLTGSMKDAFATD